MSLGGPGPELCDQVRSRFNASKASGAQSLLASMVELRDRYGPVRAVGGVDVSYFKASSGEWGVGVAVSLTYPQLKPRRCYYSIRRVCVPYIPGLLAYREMLLIAPPLKMLMDVERIDLVLVDGHGVSHPRRAGIASHLGVAFNVPSIGVAKRILVGSIVEVRGREYIVDKGEILGGVLSTGRGRVYVSPGNRVSVDSAVNLAKAMTRKRPPPEPIRVADGVSKSIKKKLAERKNVIEELGADCTHALPSY